MSPLFKGLPQSLHRPYCAQTHNSINLCSWPGLFLSQLRCAVSSCPFHSVSVLHLHAPTEPLKKGGWETEVPMSKSYICTLFSYSDPLKKKSKFFQALSVRRFPPAGIFFFSQRNPFLGRSPSLSPNVIWFQAFGILMRNDWVLIAQRVKCRSHHQYRASSRPQEISLPKSKTARLPSIEREGEGLWLVITDEQIIKSTSLLILLFFKIKNVQPNTFKWIHLTEETLRRHRTPCLS